MPIIYEPTLIKTHTIFQLNNTGGSEDLDFDFALNEGAKIEKVELMARAPAGVAGTMEVGLNLKPSAGSPAAAYDIFEDEDVLCATISHAEAATEQTDVQHVDFHNDSVYIVKNLTAQAYSSGASNKNGIVKVYYKRCRFSDAELGNLLRNY